jgi:hypothetical protein
MIFVCSCSYEALESDEEKGSDNESDVSKLPIVCLAIIILREIFRYDKVEQDFHRVRRSFKMSKFNVTQYGVGMVHSPQ